MLLLLFWCPCTASNTCFQSVLGTTEPIIIVEDFTIRRLFDSCCQTRPLISLCLSSESSMIIMMKEIQQVCKLKVNIILFFFSGSVGELVCAWLDNPRNSPAGFNHPLVLIKRKRLNLLIFHSWESFSLRIGIPSRSAPISGPNCKHIHFKRHNKHAQTKCTYILPNERHSRTSISKIISCWCPMKVLVISAEILINIVTTKASNREFLCPTNNRENFYNTTLRLFRFRNVGIW